MSAPTRVVQVAAHYPPYLGGVELVVAALARELVHQGTPVEVLTTRLGSRGHRTREVREGVVVRRFRALSLGGTPLSLGLMLALLRQPRGTLVHVHGPHALVAEMVRLACWVRGSSYVLHFHLDVDASSRWGGWVLPLYKHTLLAGTVRAAARVVALSEEMAGFLVRRYGADPERVGVLHNGVDERFFRPRRRPQGSGPEAHDALKVLFVGRMARQKNVPRLLRALQRCQDDLGLTLDAVLVGDGEPLRSFESLAGRLGLDGVRFAGRQSPDQVAGWMDWADVLVSSSDREGMPLVVLEAMAAGVPVLATDVPGTRGLLADVGLLVAPTADALADGLAALVGDPALRARLADLGRAKAREHAWPAICEELLVHYDLARVAS